MLALAVTGWAVAVGAQERGNETGLPLPRFVSIKAPEANARRGPGFEHRIDWVFRRRGMPVLITGEYGNWRRVSDREGVGGWMHHSLLSGTRTAIVEEDMLTLRVRPGENAPARAILENGVVARLGECRPDWCELSAGGYDGWVRRDALWGVDPELPPG